MLATIEAPTVAGKGFEAPKSKVLTRNQNDYANWASTNHLCNSLEALLEVLDLLLELRASER